MDVMLAVVHFNVQVVVNIYQMTIQNVIVDMNLTPMMSLEINYVV
jgi:hypothetical protein